MLDISTRPANQGDLAALRDIYRRASLGNEGDRAGLLASPGLLEWAGDLASGQTRVATDGLGRILGFATVVGIEGGRELEDLFVDPDAVRRGVATRLVLEAVTQAARDGVPWIEVTANQHAAEFYASVGFVWVRDDHTPLRPAPRLRRVVEAPD